MVTAPARCYTPHTKDYIQNIVLAPHHAFLPEQTSGRVPAGLGGAEELGLRGE